MRLFCLLANNLLVAFFSPLLALMQVSSIASCDNHRAGENYFKKIVFADALLPFSRQTKQPKHNKMKMMMKNNKNNEKKKKSWDMHSERHDEETNSLSGLGLGCNYSLRTWASTDFIEIASRVPRSIIMRLLGVISEIWLMWCTHGRSSI